MYNLLIAKRFEVIRLLIEDTSLDFIKEFILLVAKCSTFTDHDKKILRSLAQVAHPSLAPEKKESASYDPNTIWTTQEGYTKTQERVRQIGTVEMVENAREVEEAKISWGPPREFRVQICPQEKKIKTARGDEISFKTT